MKMKKLFCLLLGIGVLWMTACEAKGTEKETNAKTAAETAVFRMAENGVTPVVYGEEPLPAVYAAAKELTAFLNGKGFNVEYHDDFTAGKEPLAREILIGETGREESERAYAELGELSYLIRVDGEKLVVAGSSPRITAYAVTVLEKMFASGTETVITETRGSYAEALPEGGLTGYAGKTNGSENRPTVDVVPSAVPARTWEEGAYETGKTVTVSAENEKYGGAQFVVKLFTEGLSRAPEGTEYAGYVGLIEEKGCTVPTLTALAETMFSSELFRSAGLNGRETVFAVTRAILNRDPTEAEAKENEGKDAAALARSLCESGEFAALLPGIRSGAYFWGKNRTDAYTGSGVMTAKEVNSLLKKEKTVTLPQGTLILADETVVLPEGSVLATEGEPEHYAQMARIIRTGDITHNLVEMKDGAVLKNVYLEGNLSAQAKGTQETAFGAGGNVRVDGNGCAVRNCRASDPCSTFGFFTMPGTEKEYLGGNLITCYASDHTKTWLDGIKCMSTDSLIEYNDVIDATDAGIAVFRYITGLVMYQQTKVGPETYFRAQNSVVRFNKVIQAGNSSYVTLDFESNNINWSEDYMPGTTLNYPENPANFTGFVLYENQIWTSMTAHTHLAVTLSTQPWTAAGMTDRVFGGTVMNNYTPDGCHICTAAGIVADGCTGVTVRGNSFSLFLGNWCEGRGVFRARIASVNPENCSGDFQPGFEETGIAGRTGCFITNAYNENGETQTLKEAILHEAPVTVSAERFLSGQQ